MLDALFNETLTIRRPVAGSRQASNEVVYQALKDESEIEVRIRGRLERRGRMVKATDGTETTSDATLLYRAGSAVELQVDDIVVDLRGQAYRVMRLDTADALFGGTSYKRADLEKTRIPVPEDDDDAE